ncbi:MAG: hypothetical protein P4M04_02365 [Acidobacteriota bacterium]|nr:hypothetical protein [Acidobacteriota bacterium]
MRTPRALISRQGQRLFVHLQPHAGLHVGDALDLLRQKLHAGGIGEGLPVLPKVRQSAVVFVTSGGVDLEKRRLGDAHQRCEFLQVGMRWRQTQDTSVVEDDHIPAVRWHRFPFCHRASRR